MGKTEPDDSVKSLLSDESWQTAKFAKLSTINILPRLSFEVFYICALQHVVTLPS